MVCYHQECLDKAGYFVRKIMCILNSGNLDFDILLFHPSAAEFNEGKMEV